MGKNYLEKELYEKIKEDKQLFEFLQNGSLDGLWYWDLQHPENEWMNDRFWEVLGYDPDKKPHKSASWQDIINKDDLEIATDNFRRHCENPNHPYDQIVRYTHKNGSTVWIRCRGMAIRDKSGNPIRMLGAHQNITDLKKREQELKKAKTKAEKSEARYQDLFENMNAGFIHFEVVLNNKDKPVDLIVLNANQEFANTTGVTLEEAIGEPITKVLPNIEFDKADWIGRYSRVALTGESTQFIQKSDLLGKYYSASAYKTGVNECAVTFTDITDLKYAEEALRKSEERFRTAQEYSPDGFTILKPLRNEKNEIVDFEWIYQNQTISRINDTSGQSVVGKRLLDLFPSYRNTEIFEAYIRVANTGNPVILEDIYAGKELSKATWLRLVVTPMDNEIAIHAQDITERKLIEVANSERKERAQNQRQLISELTFDEAFINAHIDEALEKLTRKLVDVMQVDRASVWQISADQATISRKLLYDSTTGINSSLVEFKTKSFPSYFSAIRNDSQIDAEDAQNDVRTLELNKSYLIPLHIHSLLDSAIQHDGKMIGIISVEHCGSLRNWEADEKAFMSAVSNMVSRLFATFEQKKAEESLLKFKQAVESSSITIVITDVDGVIEYVNPFFTELTGYKPEEAFEKKPNILKSGYQTEEFYKDLWDTIKSGKEWSGEFLNKKKNGELYWESAIISPVFAKKSGDISHFVAIKEDVTELMKKEEALKESLKEKETLLSEVHHRVKNNLAVISAMLQLRSFNERDQSVLDLINDSTSRIKAIANIHELLYQNDSFSEIDLSLNIERLIAEIENMYNSVSGIEIEKSCSNVQLNINQAVPCSLIINEVLVNCFKHAFKHGEEGKIRVQLDEDDGEVHVNISDDGIGIPMGYQKMDHEQGFSIIEVLTQQLLGKFEYKRINPGTNFSLVFKKDNKRGSSSNIINKEKSNRVTL